MHLIKSFFFWALFSYVSPSFANPVPLGLEVGVAKCEAIKAKYRIIETLEGKYGITHLIDIKDIPIAGIKSVVIDCDKSQVIQAVMITAEKDKFDYFYKPLTEKYKLIKESLPFVGTKTASFHDGNVRIQLTAIHLSFDMQVTYLTDSLLELILSDSEKEEKEQRKTEKGLL